MIDAELLARARDAELLATAERLGARLKRAGAAEWAGPCPVCGGRDRFAVNVTKQLWSCRGCAKGGRDAIALVMHVHGLNFRQAVAFLAAGEARSSPLARPEPAGKTASATTTDQALALWREAVDPRETLVERYLASRGLRLSRSDARPLLTDVHLHEDLAGDVLRWHPRIGAMLALFRNIETDRPQAVSRTFLDRQGRKIGRKFLGPVGGAAIMLDRFDIVLHVGE
jgi:hypothetical protein